MDGLGSVIGLVWMMRMRSRGRGSEKGSRTLAGARKRAEGNR